MFRPLESFKSSNPARDACTWPMCECSRGCEFVGGPNKQRQIDDLASEALAEKLHDDLINEILAD